MPEFVRGELVVYRRSKTTDLKRKVFKVAEVDRMHDQVRVVTPGGKMRVFRHWDLASFDDYADRLQRNVEWAERYEQAAARRRQKDQECLSSFQYQRAEAYKYFKI